MRRPIRVAILATTEVEPWVALGIHDSFWAVGVLWNRVMGQPEDPAFAPQIIAASDKPLLTCTGAEIQPHASIDNVGKPDIIFIPSILTPSGGDFGRANPRALDWIRDAHRAGTRIVSSCTGSLALAEAGLLDGLEATTHWAFVDQMRAEYPNVKVRADRIIVSADKEGRIVSAGGATSWTDLVLYLVGRHVSEEEARRLAKMSLFDWHHNGQNPYARLTMRQSTDAAIGKAQEWAAENYCEQDIVTAMAERAKLPIKTFTRRFKAATGYTPLDYVQRLRIEESKQMLETSDAAVENIAEDVGYHDAASFRRLFKRLVGESPAEYRRRQIAPDFVKELPR